MTVVLLVVGVYFTFAAAGIVTSGAFKGFPLLPPGASLWNFPGARWHGVMWLPGRLLWLSTLLGFFEIVALMTVAFFIFASPLFALCFANQVTGRRPPHGTLAHWYEGIATRHFTPPASCRIPSGFRRRISDAIERMDARFSRPVRR